MDITSSLKALCGSTGVSGEETGAARTALELLLPYAPDAYIDKFNNVRAFIGDKNNGKPTLLLDAHIDEIGFIVTYIGDDGFIKVAKCGGIDRRLVLAQTVTVWGRKPIKGVISTLPPHVAKDGGKTAKIDELAVDTGFSKEQLSEIVSLGDKITIDSAFSPMNQTQVTSKAIDDRSGVCAVLYALELLKNAESRFNLAVQFAVQEEVGGTGAKISAFDTDADFGIAVDVSFAKTPGVKPEKSGKIGGGAMIGFAASLDRALSRRLTALAENAGLKYQCEIMGGDTGTNADEISSSRRGIRTMLVSIPLKYMHTPVEVVNIEDIKNVGALIAEFAREGE